MRPGLPITLSLCALVASGCAQLKLTRVQTHLVEEEHERTVIGMDHVRVSHEVVDEGARLRLLVERHDICQIRRFEIRTPAQQRTGEVKGLLGAYLLSGGLAALSGGLYLIAQRFPQSATASADYDPARRGCLRDGTWSEANCTKDYEGFIGVSVLVGASALYALGHTLYAHSQRGVRHDINGDAARVMTDDQRVACQVRTYQRVEAVLLDERGKELATARTSKSGHAWLNTLNAHPDHLFHFDALIRDEGKSHRLRLSLDPDQRAQVAQAIAQHRKRRAPPDLRGTLVLDDSGGNGDRILDAGEEVSVLIKAQNVGRGPAEGVVAILSTPEAARAHLDAPWRVSLGDIPAGETRLGRMTLFAREDLPQGEITLEARLSEDTGFDSAAFSLKAPASALRRPTLQLIQHALWDDGRESAQGNGNGRIEPNELIALEVLVENSGEGVAHDVVIALESASPHVRVTHPPVEIGALLPGQRRQARLGFTVARRYQGADHLPLQLQLRERRPRFSVTPPLAFKLNAAAPAQALLQPASAPSLARIAILELSNEAQLRPQEVSYLTDLIREEALARLPRRRYFVMTRENLLEQLPPGADLAACEGACEVETGRNVGADFVISGRVLRFGEALRVALKLHETKRGALLSAGRASGASVTALEGATVEASRTLLGPLPR
ncbi:hypothetical protein KKF91_12290 [Myxococcota bacterium]|nr:hypothetical protein [Myxococcota bacterium]MBU1431311.1 hypothetical protein [Myxococcota bacterium]MBU1898925.1 hypothetical protein [Myxococcota bacterium]